MSTGEGKSHVMKPRSHGPAEKAPRSARRQPAGVELDAERVELDALDSLGADVAVKARKAPRYPRARWEGPAGRKSSHYSSNPSLDSSGGEGPAGEGRMARNLDALDRPGDRQAGKLGAERVELATMARPERRGEGPRAHAGRPGGEGDLDPAGAGRPREVATLPAIGRRR